MKPSIAVSVAKSILIVSEGEESSFAPRKNVLSRSERRHSFWRSASVEEKLASATAERLLLRLPGSGHLVGRGACFQSEALTVAAEE